MDEHQRLAEQFEVHRTRMRAVAYRMLGSLTEADDAVQEAWLHLSRSDTSGIANLGAWLTTVVSQARRFSTALTSVRPSRIQLSWTASSASLADPSIRYATARR